MEEVMFKAVKKITQIDLNGNEGGMPYIKPN